MKTLTVCILLIAFCLNYLCAEQVNNKKTSEISSDELNRLNSLISKLETSDETNADDDDDDDDEIVNHDSNDNDEYLHRNSKRMTYRYGKRMNYRYGKRAAMPFRFGKRNPEQNAQDFAEYIKQKQNLKRMNYRYGK